MRDRRVREVQEVLRASGDAGGSLLAAGLAFNALLAMTPALLFVVGGLGFVLRDPEAAADLVGSIVANVPALADLVHALLRSLISGREAFSVVGVLGFAWGASGFYGSLDEAMRRLFPGGSARGVVEQRVRGVIAVLGLIGAAVAAVVSVSLISFLEGTLLLPAGLGLLPLGGLFLVITVFVAVTLVTYVVVPTDPPRLRMALVPALVAGIGMGLLTSAFSLLAPFLVGQLAGIGVLAAMFSALVWLRLVFEMLVYGAAWARIRRDRSRRRAAPPSLDEAG